MNGAEDDDMHGRPDPEAARLVASHMYLSELEEVDASEDKLYD